jgi:LuxR family maltose regulon positive regulatory protein
VSAKLVPAAIPGTAVFRRQLVRRLGDATERKLALLVAPPGYGKSVLLAQWASTSPPRRIAWLTLEAADDADRFARHLCAALTAADGRDRGRILRRVEHGGRRMGPGFISALLADAAAMPPTAVVLDDFHTVSNPQLLSEIGLLIEEAPPTMHFVVAARMDPALPYNRLRLHEELAELRQEQLAFDRHDAHQLVGRIAHRDLTPQQLDVLLDRTEGWGAGLQLAALSLRRVPDLDAFLRAFAGDDRHVAEYLTEHVLQHQAPHVRQFLLRTSVLRRFTASLCNAVTLGRDGQAMLEHLDRGALFTNRLDNRREWFRYHPLFRTLLRQHLHASDEESEQELLRRAAAWHLARDDIETGVDYLRRAGADRDVLDAVRSHGYAMYTAGRVAAAVRWIDDVDPDEGRSPSEVQLLRGALHMMAGNTVAADVILDEVTEGESATGADRMVADMIHTWSVHDRASPRPVLAAAARSLATLDVVAEEEITDVLGMTTPSDIRRSSLLNGSAAAAYDGCFDQARAWLSRGSTLGGGRSASDVYALGLGALHDAWTGRLRSAQHQGAHAVAVAGQSAMTSQPSVLTAQLALAHVHRERDELGDAEQLLAAAATELQRTRPSALLAIHVTEQALLALARGEPGRGLGLLADHRTASRVPPPPVVGAQLRATEARLLLADGDLDGAQQVISQAPAVGADSAAAAVQVAVERQELDRATDLLEHWPEDSERATLVQRSLWQAVLEDLCGDPGEASARMATAVAIAEEEAWVAVFLDAGHHSLRLVRRLYRDSPSPYLRHIVDARLRTSAVNTVEVVELVEQFSNRELAVLRYLPTRLDNAEISAELRVSINTVKTHLKHIYRKLGVDGRKAAIVAAEQLHLL